MYIYSTEINSTDVPILPEYKSQVGQIQNTLCELQDNLITLQFNWKTWLSRYMQATARERNYIMLSCSFIALTTIYNVHNNMTYSERQKKMYTNKLPLFLF